MSARFVYSLIWTLALPVVALRLLWRARRQSGYLEDAAARFTRWRTPPPARPVIWVHAVSVGETRAAAPLVRALRERYPDHDILLTQMTPTGRDTARALFGEDARIHLEWLPYDLPGFARRFFAHFRPRVGVIMETELWPNLLLAAREAGVPVLLANARLSARSSRRYARWPSLARMTLGALAGAGAQTQADADRLTALGARHVELSGNVKFDIEPPAAQLALAEDFRSAARGRALLLAASTRDGEEALLLDAFARATLPDEVLLVIVPRHPQRFDAVAAQVAARGLALARRSREDAVTAQTRVWLGDSMGEMFAYYAAAEVALIGGSWLPFGGQNLIEACAVGTPAIVGPHTFNFLEVAEQAVQCGAAQRAADVDEALTLARALLADDVAHGRAAAAGCAFAQAHRGATAHTLQMIEAKFVGR